MNTRDSIHFDPRTWLLWGLAGALPVLMGRNPFVLALVGLSAGIVYTTLPSTSESRSLRWFVRVAFAFGTIGVVFNLLTVHAGNEVLFSLPEGIPVIGGIITLNALVYGLLSGVSLFVLVLIGVIVAVSIDWSEFVRIIPNSMVALGMAGSVAINFLPQTIASVREIREARAVRGMDTLSWRDLGGMAAAVLTSGLERASTTAELLESRGFGATMKVPQQRTWQSIGTAGALALACLTAYLVTVGQAILAAGALFAATLFAILAGRSRSPGLTRTQFRKPAFARGDFVILAGSSLALAATIVALVVDPHALQYEPFPVLAVPQLSLGLLLALVLLTLPAWIDVDDKLIS